MEQPETTTMGEAETTTMDPETVTSDRFEATTDQPGTIELLQTTVMPTRKGMEASVGTPGTTESGSNGRTGKIVGGVLGGGVGVASLIGIAVGGYKCTDGGKKLRKKRKGRFQPNKPMEMEEKTGSIDNKSSVMKTSNTSGDMDEK